MALKIIWDYKNSSNVYIVYIDGYNMDEDTDDEIERVQRKLDQESSKGKHKYKVKIRNRGR